MYPYLSVADVLERATTLIANHPLVQNPFVFNDAGLPIRITKMRKYDGLDTNANGLTLSIFPYAYMGTSNETTTSKNSALVYNSVNVGSREQGYDACSLCLVVKLQTQGYELKTTTIPGANPIVVETQMKEEYLYRWLTMLRAILLTMPLVNLGGLVQNSTVNWGAFRTVAWNVGPGTSPKGENAVFHSASLLWQLDLNAPRNWRDYPQGVAPAAGSPPGTAWLSSWVYVGTRHNDCAPIYWDTLANWLVGLDGFPIFTTPQGQRVIYKPATRQFLRQSDGVTPLTPLELEQPGANPATTPWIHTDWLLAGLYQTHYLFYNTTAAHFQTCDGTVVTTIDGHVLVWMPPGSPGNPGTTGQVGYLPAGATVPVLLPNSSDYKGFHPGHVILHDAATGAIRSQFNL
jgi:hypothetical protein